MNRRLLLCLPLALVACTTSPPPAPPLAGRWQPVAAQLGGREFPVTGFRGAVLELRADTYEFGADRGRVSLRATAVPAQMDIQGESGPNAGKSIPAIYALQNDELVICYQLGSGPRPTTFDSVAGSQLLLVRYRRI